MMNVRQKRQKLGMSPKELAYALGYSAGYIQNLEAGRQKISKEFSRCALAFFESGARMEIVVRWRRPDGTYARKPPAS